LIWRKNNNALRDLIFKVPFSSVQPRESSLFLATGTYSNGRFGAPVLNKGALLPCKRICFSESFEYNLNRLSAPYLQKSLNVQDGFCTPKTTVLRVPAYEICRLFIGPKGALLSWIRLSPFYVLSWLRRCWRKEKKLSLSSAWALAFQAFWNAFYPCRFHLSAHDCSRIVYFSAYLTISYQHFFGRFLQPFDSVFLFKRF